MKRLLILGSLMAASLAAQAVVLYEQLTDGNNCAVAQDFPDFATFSAYEFDEFVVPAGELWCVNEFFCAGTELGDPSQNQEIHLRIQQNANFTTPGTLYADINAPLSVYVAGNLTIPVTPLAILGPGTYYVSTWIKRPFGGGGGQWFWCMTLTINGTEQWFHNPGGAFGFGTDPVPGSTVFGAPEDEDFRLSGERATRLLPVDESIGRGRDLGHNLAAITNSDDVYSRIGNLPPPLPTQGDVEYLAGFTAPGAALALQPIVELACSGVPGTAVPQTIELKRWSNNQFVEVARNPGTVADTTRTALVTTDPNQYIRGGDNRVEVRCRSFERGSLTAAWTTRFDMINLNHC